MKKLTEKSGIQSQQSNESTLPWSPPTHLVCSQTRSDLHPWYVETGPGWWQRTPPLGCPWTPRGLPEKAPGWKYHYRRVQPGLWRAEYWRWRRLGTLHAVAHLHFVYSPYIFPFIFSLYLPFIPSPYIFPLYLRIISSPCIFPFPFIFPLYISLNIPFISSPYIFPSYHPFSLLLPHLWISSVQVWIDLLPSVNWWQTEGLPDLVVAGQAIVSAPLDCRGHQVSAGES